MDKPTDIADLDRFAQMIGVPKFVLTKQIFSADRYYKTFRISKRSGAGYRTISAPAKELKGIQRWILVNILRHLPISPASTAFRPGCSIVKNAAPHCCSEFVLAVDIADFYPSISTKRVLGLFKQVGYCKEVAFALARLTTCKGILPQGAPTSPEIANLICRHLDARLLGFSSRNGWKYSRYCDDLTISGSGHVTSGAIKTVEDIVLTEGFVVRESKTHMMRKNRRQIVTGLVVNEKPSIPRFMRKRLRAIFHQAALDPNDFVTRFDELSGHAAYLKMVRPADPMLCTGGMVETCLEALKSCTHQT